jgi:hypothetical protein
MFNRIPCPGWRDELYPVYRERGQDANPLPGVNICFDVERAAAAIFGFATFGVHMTGQFPPSGPSPGLNFY